MPAKLTLGDRKAVGLAVGRHASRTVSGKKPVTGIERTLLDRHLRGVSARKAGCIPGAGGGGAGPG